MKFHQRYAFLLQAAVALLLIFGNGGSLPTPSISEPTRTEWVSIRKQKSAFQVYIAKASGIQAPGKSSFEFQSLQVARKTHLHLLLYSTIYSYIPRFLFHTHSLLPEGNQLIIA